MRRVLMRRERESAGPEELMRGLAPQAGPAPACLLTGNGFQPALAEQYRMLRTSLLQRGNGRHPRSILVTSSLPGEGKSTVAANLAIAVARSRTDRALLIDCDLHNPGLERLFGLRAEAGLADYLRGEADLDGLLLPTPVAGLSLLAAGRAAPEAAELLGSERMISLLADLRRRPERIAVLDSPPLLLAADPALLAAQVDAVLLVVRAGLAEREAVARAIEPLGGARLLGVVFNGLEPDAGDWRGKYYRHYYRGER